MNKEKMRNISERDLQIALANQYTRLGINKPWGEKNQELETARKIMKKHDITIQDINRVCGMSEQNEEAKQIEKDSHLQGDLFVTCIHGEFYLANYDMEIEKI